MLFNSFDFLIFFIVVTSLYFLIPYNKRWILLLLSSCHFYMAFVPSYILILGFTIVVDYFAGIFIEKSSGTKRKLFLFFSLMVNIFVLAFFKYFNFFNQNISFFLENIGFSNPVPYLSFLLPIGLSFHTFQAMSYTIEIYRGNQKAERHFGIYSLYVMFYPQLVAGPIERPQNLLPQFREKFDFDYDRVSEGLKLVVWGFFKKLVIADRLAIYVNAVYDNPQEHGTITIITATLFFSFQIYCDFSGYSDIARGCAKIMGFKLMENFNRPYLSKSISEFWKRWHISLSTWFRDYLYISLGGNRGSVLRWYMNLFIVFLLSGLWHGANWTYVIWGALNGFYLVSSIIFKPLRIKIYNLTRLNKQKTLYVGGASESDQHPGLKSEVFYENKSEQLSNFLQIIITFMLISFSWIFFRANNIDDVIIILNKFIHFERGFFYAKPSIFLYSVLVILFLVFTELKEEYFKDSFSFFNNKNWIVRNLSYSFLVITILLIGVFDGGQFIYFQF